MSNSEHLASGAKTTTTKAIPWPTKSVTILYTDLKDSSKTNREMHNAAYIAEVRDPHYVILREELARY